MKTQDSQQTRSLRKQLFWLAWWFTKGAGVFTVFSIVLVGIYGTLPVVLTPLMMIRASESLGRGQAPVLQRRWISLDEVSPKLMQAMIAAEDMKFFEHNGFDWEAIEKALKHNERSRKIRGASTISQQVAKNVFLWPKRSWIRKASEAYFTGLIELFWSKQRIMEVYLNIVELGDGVYGVEAASQRYLRKSASKLSTSEAALIAAVLPNPRQFQIDRPSPYVRFRQSMIIRRMPSAAQLIKGRSSEARPQSRSYQKGSNRASKMPI